MVVSDIVENFREFLIDSWRTISHGSGRKVDDDWVNDWLQANWELLVERPVASNLGYPCFLEVYGEGADCCSSSSRVWMPEALPTHKIVCRGCDSRPIFDILDGNIVEESFRDFDYFATWSNGVSRIEPPFDVVVLTSNTQGSTSNTLVLARLSEIEFFVEEV